MKPKSSLFFDVPVMVGSDPDASVRETAVVKVKISIKEFKEQVAKTLNGEVRGGKVYSGSGDLVRIMWEEM